MLLLGPHLTRSKPLLLRLGRQRYGHVATNEKLHRLNNTKRKMSLLNGYVGVLMLVLSTRAQSWQHGTTRQEALCAVWLKLKTEDYIRIEKEKADQQPLNFIRIHLRRPARLGTKRLYVIQSNLFSFMF